MLFQFSQSAVPQLAEQRFAKKSDNFIRTSVFPSFPANDLDFELNRSRTETTALDSGLMVFLLERLALSFHTMSDRLSLWAELEGFGVELHSAER